MESFIDIVPQFFQQIEKGTIEIYNEFSLQHEIGFYFRSNSITNDRVYFERPVTYFGYPAKNFWKKEIDICLVGPDKEPKLAVELKFPRQGQHPEQMFAACIDIVFLEELVDAGFQAGLFIMVVDDPLFYSGRETEGIYRFFRAGHPINGRISRPTGNRHSWIEVVGNYRVLWKHLSNRMSYWMTLIKKNRET